MNLAREVLRGARRIAAELFDDEGSNDKEKKKNERWVYHKHERGDLPTWLEGNQIVTTLTALRDHYTYKNQKGDAEKEAAAE